MQLQLYGFGSIATWILHALELSTHSPPPIKGGSYLILNELLFLP